MVVMQNYPAVEQTAEPELPELLAPSSAADEPLTRQHRLPGIAVLASIALVQFTWLGLLGYASWFILD